MVEFPSEIVFHDSYGNTYQGVLKRDAERLIREAFLLGCVLGGIAATIISVVVIVITRYS